MAMPEAGEVQGLEKGHEYKLREDHCSSKRYGQDDADFTR